MSSPPTPQAIQRADQIMAGLKDQTLFHYDIIPMISEVGPHAQGVVEHIIKHHLAGNKTHGWADEVYKQIFGAAVRADRMDLLLEGWKSIDSHLLRRYVDDDDLVDSEFRQALFTFIEDRGWTHNYVLRHFVKVCLQNTVADPNRWQQALIDMLKFSDLKAKGLVYPLRQAFFFYHSGYETLKESGIDVDTHVWNVVKILQSYGMDIEAPVETDEKVFEGMLHLYASGGLANSSQLCTKLLLSNGANWRKLLDSPTVSDEVKQTLMTSPIVRKGMLEDVAQEHTVESKTPNRAPKL